MRKPGPQNPPHRVSVPGVLNQYAVCVLGCHQRQGILGEPSTQPPGRISRREARIPTRERTVLANLRHKDPKPARVSHPPSCFFFFCVCSPCYLGALLATNFSLFTLHCLTASLFHLSVLTALQFLLSFSYRSRGPNTFHFKIKKPPTLQTHKQEKKQSMSK